MGPGAVGGLCGGNVRVFEVLRSVMLGGFAYMVYWNVLELVMHFEDFLKFV